MNPSLTVPFLQAREQPPPPLPPPRHIEVRGGQDPGWQWGNTNSPRDTGFGGNRLATVKPGSSLYGGATGGHPREPSLDMFNHGREPSLSRSIDGMSEHSTSEDDRSSKARPSLGNHRYGTRYYISPHIIEQVLSGLLQGPAALECLWLRCGVVISLADPGLLEDSHAFRLVQNLSRVACIPCAYKWLAFSFQSSCVPVG